jgi:predicted deacetylase
MVLEPEVARAGDRGGGSPMIPGAAEYLLRFDDLCPTVSAERWLRFESLIQEFRLQPILAVVPDNRDPDLELSPADPAFWQRMRALEDAGAVIGLHGCRHLCLSQGRSLLGLARTSEFAGVAAETQHAWIREGLRILRGHGLNPRIWVAPRHGFDAHTLDALQAEGISLVSDGFARTPFLRQGVTWIPQQLWGPVVKSKGLWTICLHANTAHDAQIQVLREFLTAHAAQFTSVDRVLFRFQPTTLTLAERVHTEAAFRRLKLSRAVRRIGALSPFRRSKSS